MQFVVFSLKLYWCLSALCINSLFLFLQGGIAFIAIKGVLKIYYKQSQYHRQANRVILDYDEDRTPTSSTSNSSVASQWCHQLDLIKLGIFLCPRRPETVDKKGHVILEKAMVEWKLKSNNVRFINCVDDFLLNFRGRKKVDMLQCVNGNLPKQYVMEMVDEMKIAAFGQFFFFFFFFFWYCIV